MPSAATRLLALALGSALLPPLVLCGGAALGGEADPLVRPSSKEEDTRPNTCSIEMDPQSSRWDTTPGRVSVNLASSSPLRVLWLGAQVIPGGRKTRGAGTGRRLLIHGPPTMSRPNRPGATALDEAREGNLSQPSRTPPL